jgi:DNA polymerase elongation subunit (family B)
MKKRQFKLIKKYPGSLDVGTVVYLDNNLYLYWGTSLNKEEVENNPEFFEEIIEKQFEILSLKADECQKFTFTLKENGLYSCIDEMGSQTLDSLLKCNWKIHSIRRLSDNEVFSIGDAVQSIRSNWQGNDCKIETIHAKEDGDIDFTINQNGDKGTYRNCLNNFRKAKPVLFVTEDGVEVFEGDNIHWVRMDIKTYLYNTQAALAHKKNLLVENNIYLVFSSFEKAQEWIIFNKPVLSLKDVASIYPGINKEHNSPSHQAELLKALVKSKL